MQPHELMTLIPETITWDDIEKGIWMYAIIHLAVYLFYKVYTAINKALRSLVRRCLRVMGNWYLSNPKRRARHELARQELSVASGVTVTDFPVHAEPVPELTHPSAEASQA